MDYDISQQGQPVVRRHLTVFNSIYRSYENIFQVRSIREKRIMQPHLNYMKNFLIPHFNTNQPADGICAHFLVHGFNRLQKSPVNVGCWSSEARRLVLGTQSGEFTLWEVFSLFMTSFFFSNGNILGRNI